MGVLFHSVFFNFYLCTHICICRKGSLVKTTTKTTTDRSKGIEVAVVKDNDGRRRVHILSAGYNAWNVQVIRISLCMYVFTCHPTFCLVAAEGKELN